MYARLQVVGRSIAAVSLSFTGLGRLLNFAVPNRLLQQALYIEAPTEVRLRPCCRAQYGERSRNPGTSPPHHRPSELHDRGYGFHTRYAPTSLQSDWPDPCDCIRCLHWYLVCTEENWPSQGQCKIQRRGG